MLIHTLKILTDTNLKMNKKMTSNLKSGSKRLLVSLFSASILSMILSSNMAFAKIEPLDQVVAVVNNDVIMQSELDARLKQIEQQIRQRNLEVPSHQQLDKQVLERMITEDLQVQAAKRQGIHINDQELSSAIDTLAKRNKMSLSKFKQTLQSQGISYAAFRAQIRREMLIARIQQIDVLYKIQITEQDVHNYLSSPEGKQKKEYHLSHILIATPDDATPADIQKASKKAEKIYTELTKDHANFGNIALAESQGQLALKGGDLGWRSTSQLPDLFIRVAEKLKVGGISRPVRDPSGFHILKLVGEKGAAQHFQTQYHVRHILIAPNEVRSNTDAHEIADKLYQKLEHKGNFSELAKAYSDDNGSSLSGGGLGWVTPDSLVPAFAKEVTTLPLDTYSKPFHSKYGWHIVEVLGKRKEDVSQKMQQAQVREVLTKRRFEEELPIWIRQLKNDAYIKEML